MCELRAVVTCRHCLPLFGRGCVSGMGISGVFALQTKPIQSAYLSNLCKLHGVTFTCNQLSITKARAAKANQAAVSIYCNSRSFSHCIIRSKTNVFDTAVFARQKGEFSFPDGRGPTCRHRGFHFSVVAEFVVFGDMLRYRTRRGRAPAHNL